MRIFPAIDLVGGKAVRLYQGDYDRMTTYSDDPRAVAQEFSACGADAVHLVDLEGARDGGTPNLDTVAGIVQAAPLFTEIGGGIRSLETVERYLSIGVGRVILGTAALTDEPLLREAVRRYGDRIAVGVDIRDGFVAIRGWREQSETPAFQFLTRLQDMGVGTVIVTDISRDGAMKGTNLELYNMLSGKLSLSLVASGGVSTIADVQRLRAMDLAGAIIGKAIYTGALDLRRAIEVAK